MRSTQKRIFGFVGLAFVAAMTFMAAVMPSPEASAATESVTDTIVVKVINEDGNPHVKITEPSDGAVVFDDSTDFTIDYNSTDKSFLDVTFIGQNPDGTSKQPIVISNYAGYDLDFAAGTTTTPIDLNYYDTTELGYGTFIFSLRNIGIAGVEVPGEEISIVHSPFNFNVSDTDEDDGSVKVDLDFKTETDPDTGETTPSEIGKFDLVVRDSDGNIVYGPVEYDPKDLINPDGTIKDIDIPFGDFANKTDTYKISITAYDKNGDYMYTMTKDRFYNYLPAPDTGLFFQNLNISKEDYLITGLIIFFIFAVVGFAIVARNHKTETNSKKRR